MDSLEKRAVRAVVNYLNEQPNVVKIIDKLCSSNVDIAYFDDMDCVHLCGVSIHEDRFAPSSELMISNETFEKEVLKFVRDNTDYMGQIVYDEFDLVQVAENKAALRHHKNALYW